MAWEWVAPVCTGTIGSIGIVATGLTARGGRKHAESVASERIGHERKLAEDARRQARLADAYVELLAIVNRIAAYADLIRPVIDTTPPRTPPPLPTLDEQARAEALVMAFGTKPVEDLFETWRQTVWEIIGADQMIGLMLEERSQGQSSGKHYMETWNRLETEMRPAQRSARKKLAEAIGVELRSRPETQP